jgi:hypothetical protein
MVSRRRHWPARERAIVLVEAIVGSVLVGVALAVILGLGARAISRQAEGEQLRIAAMMLDEQLNLILARGPDQYESRFGLSGVCDPPFSNFTYELWLSGGVGGKPYDVTATVRWQAGGVARAESISTRIAPRLGDEPDPDRRPTEEVSRIQ